MKGFFVECPFNINRKKCIVCATFLGYHCIAIKLSPLYVFFSIFIKYTNHMYTLLQYTHMPHHLRYYFFMPETRFEASERKTLLCMHAYINQGLMYAYKHNIKEKK